MRIKYTLSLGHPDPLAVSILSNGPALLVIKQICDHDLVQDLLMNGWIDNRSHRLDAPIKIPGHQIRRSKLNPCLGTGQTMPIAKGVDTRMFEKTAND